MALNRCLRVVRQPSERPREQLLHYKPNAVQASVPIYEKEEKINPPFKDERRIKAKGWVISEDGTSYFKLPSNLHNESSLRPVQNFIKGDFV